MSELVRRLHAVPSPAPVLSREDKALLTKRQVELLDQLDAAFKAGFSHFTMAALASQLGCSLRTLYGIAPSRDQLVMVVVDRNLWRTGRFAMAAVEPDMAPLEALKAYLQAANSAVQDTTEGFARDTAEVEEWHGVGRAHNEYLVAVTACLLNMAKEAGDIGDVDVAAASHIVAGLGRTFAGPDIISQLRSTPTAAANEILELLLAGLRDHPGTATNR